jgi:hypothetical protein
MKTTVGRAHDTLIISIPVTKRGNSWGLNLPQTLRDKFGLSEPGPDNKDELGFFIQTNREGETFMAVARIED